MTRWWLAWLLGPVGCLPGDPRPPPAEIQLTLVGDPDTKLFITDDQWAIDYKVIFVQEGAAEWLESDTCFRFSRTTYVTDLNVAPENPAPIALIFGLGQCLPLVRFNPSAAFGLANAGDGDEPYAFELPIVPDFAALEGCLNEDGQPGPVVLESGEVREEVFEVVGTAPFRQPDGSVRFEPLLGWDTNFDRTISIGEASAAQTEDAWLAVAQNMFTSNGRPCRFTLRE
ncbi:MAG: hypothetical protein AAGA56_07850 [Myxococcota bacterium]